MTKNRPPEGSRLVYSTDGSPTRPAEYTPRKASKPKPSSGSAPDVPDDGVVRLHRGKPARGGKPQTLVTGLPGTEAELDSALKQLKQSLGTGGSREGRTLLINGEQRERLRELLEARGHRIKMAGG